MMQLNQDRKNDVLYIGLSDMSNSYGDETDDGVVILYDMDTNAVTGITIFDFVKRFQSGRLEKLELPVKIDFMPEVVRRLKM